jgi:hypothetical protein
MLSNLVLALWAFGADFLNAEHETALTESYDVITANKYPFNIDFGTRGW